MDFVVAFMIALVLCYAAPTSSLPLQREGVSASSPESPGVRSLRKRYIDTSSSLGASSRGGGGGGGRMRTRRSEEEQEEQCERRRLCELHAHSGGSLLAAFQLYFVNRENARLWDHRARSPADCQRRFRCDR